MKTFYREPRPEELVYDLEVKTKEEALNYLYRAGIVTKKGNLQKFYRNTNTVKPKAEKIIIH